MSINIYKIFSKSFGTDVFLKELDDCVAVAEKYLDRFEFILYYDPYKAAEAREYHEFDQERAAWNANPNRKMSFDQNLAKQGMATFGDDPSTIAEYEHYANWDNPKLEEKVDREYYTVGDDGTLSPNPVTSSDGSAAGTFTITKPEKPKQTPHLTLLFPSSP